MERFLADTWWYGLTRRLPEEKFVRLARLRVEQGFSAVQIVVGIPPEVGPENPSAASDVGPAWGLNGDINPEYLALARRRIRLLNEMGLLAIIYGAWGHQIRWLGVEGMKRWWASVIQATGDLRVLYCLTGESNLWVGEEARLLPGKTTGDLLPLRRLPAALAPFATRGAHVARQIRQRLAPSERARKRRRGNDRIAQRVQEWSEVLAFVAGLTDRPLLIHPLPGETSQEAVRNPELLSAVTVQTGHDPSVRPLLWRWPQKILAANPEARYINLEPWYEGIGGQFGPEDQLFAYWVSMLAGAHAYCYGAHGIWNVGDGAFLSHWGDQTFEQAAALETPRLLGLSHRVFLEVAVRRARQVMIRESRGRLLEIHRIDESGGSIAFYPDTARVEMPLKGRILSPLEGRFVPSLPDSGPAVVITDE